MKKKAKEIASLITVMSTLASAQAINVIAAENTGYKDDDVRRIYCINDITSTSPSVNSDSFVEDENDALIRDQIAKAYDKYEELGWAGYDGQANNTKNNHKKNIYFINSSSDRPQNKNLTVTFNSRIKLGEESYNSVNYAKAFDAVAHEYTHLVTESKLEWNGCEKGETFCLLEAYSDIMGELFDDNCDWKIGADIYDEIGKSLRDIAHPECTERPISYNRNYENNFFVDYDELSAYLKSNTAMTNADSGVFSDATRGAMVITHAAFLMNVNGISRNDLKLLWYRSMDTMKDITKETRYAKFSDCRKAVVAAANIFSGFKKQRYLEIINAAFDNANVYIDGDVNDDGITDTRDIAALTAYFYENSPILNTNRRMRSADVNHDGNVNIEDLEALKKEVITSETQASLSSAASMASFEENEKLKFPNDNMWKSHIEDPTDSTKSITFDPRSTENNYVTINSTFFKGYDNSFDTASQEPYYQCAGFAKRLQYDYFGTTKYLILNDPTEYMPRIGDHLRLDDGSCKEDGTHSIFITSVDGDSFTFADCNGAGGSNGMCIIKWDQRGSISRDSSGNISCIYLGRQRYTFKWTERPLMVGDVNGDSIVDYSDAYTLWNMMGSIPASNDLGARYRFIAADIDQNGVIDINDLNCLSNEVFSDSIGLGYIK